MANEFKEHVWIIDTADAANIVTDFVRIHALRWVVRDSGVATDRIEVANADGDVLWEAVNEGGTAQFEVESMALTYLHGLRVPTLARGKLYIYHDLNAT